SPDDTPAVAQSFADPRVRHVRHERNLGHLRNYNAGIAMSRGEYIWLISADDCLRGRTVLERYVSLLDANPRVGYVFCQGVGLTDEGETGLLPYSSHGSSDAIFRGHAFVERLIRGNTILAAAGMVRRQCYDKVGMFPLDMPWGGDWYLWLAFAVHF